MQFERFHIFFWFVFPFVMFSTVAEACPGPGAEKHHFPSCSIPHATPDERVTVVRADGRGIQTSHHFGDGSRRTQLVVVNVGEGDHRHFIVLEAYKQTIWKFKGETQNVSKVVVLGSMGFGPHSAGVMGIPKDRIVFTNPDLSLLDAVQRTSCTRIYRACTAGQWFTDQIFESEVNDRYTFHPKIENKKRHVHEVARPLRGHNALDKGKVVTIVSNKSLTAIFQVHPNEVVSQKPLQPYILLPGRKGVQTLLDRRDLLPLDEFWRGRISAYGEVFSARYRSRFDPDFLYKPWVDYVVAKETTLPPQMPQSVLFVPKGVPAPDMNGNRGRSVCLYFEDPEMEPVNDDIYKSTSCRKQRWGKRDRDIKFPDKGDHHILSDAHSFDTFELEGSCVPKSYSLDTHFAVLALSEGRYKRNRRAPMRIVDVKIKRNQPVVLYASMEGSPVHWRITSPNEVSVFLKFSSEYGYDQVSVNGVLRKYERLGLSGDGCSFYPPAFPNRRGPSIAMLNKMMGKLLGHEIDQFVFDEEKGVPPKGKARSPVTYEIQ
jgi:hypothetical protein